ncbi:hypothetical protein [Pseudomonas sp. MUP55]|uniref:hypothetical protein n=1 Tax=Pseudomonas sp. MUP55 TaxID=3087234 RepID=UPI002A59F5DB|nr:MULTISPECIES: hypothetical protein [unclassified Pseudomonas]WPN90305.1 hypothetical protein SC319_13575 [Pseudomonas sp. MUP56]WPN95830.1 hypothetical protein SC318_13580 [Pseudomonas sp. MUP55]
MSDSGFKPRDPFSIDWERQYNVGPSDEHLHAMGQFIVNYSAVEWQISNLFAFFLKMPVADAQKLSVEANISMAGMVRYVQRRISDLKTHDQQATDDLLYTLKAFDAVSSLRHKIVHWQWGLNEGATASLTDLIKPKNANKSNAILKISELRDQCHKLMRILQAISLNAEILRGIKTRAQILEIRTGTSPEKLFRP